MLIQKTQNVIGPASRSDAALSQCPPQQIAEPPRVLGVDGVDQHVLDDEAIEREHRLVIAPDAGVRARRLIEVMDQAVDLRLRGAEPGGQFPPRFSNN